MEPTPLYNLIKSIEYGTKLHIGVYFLKDYGNLMCELPNSHTIHQSPVCDVFKTAGKNWFARCVRCRNLALKKAITSKEAFGGLCVNGIYEYTHPVLIDNDVCAVVFIGNILDQDKGVAKITKNANGKKIAFESMQANFSPEMCKCVAQSIDNTIRFLLEKYPDKATDQNPLIKNIKSYIENNLEFGVDIHSVAAVFHYNSRYLSRLFKKETELSLNQYIIIRRLKRAKALLKSTNHSVIDISTETGFNNVTYFNKLFKVNFGITPTEYRKLKSK